LMLPSAVLLIINAELIIRGLFTSKFLDAVPIFQIFSVSLVLYCFEFDLPVRALGVTKYFLRISWIGLITKIVLIWLAYLIFGFPGPAIAALIAQFVIITYLAWKCVTVTKVQFSELLSWRQIGIISVVGFMGLPIFPLAHYAIGNYVAAAIVASGTYVVFYIWATRLFEVAEMVTLTDRLLKYVRSNK